MQISAQPAVHGEELGMCQGYRHDLIPLNSSDSMRRTEGQNLGNKLYNCIKYKASGSLWWPKAHTFLLPTKPGYPLWLRIFNLGYL